MRRREAEETEIITREYDTDKPTDSITGKPPLKKETYTTNRKQRDESTQSRKKENTQADLAKKTAGNEYKNQDVQVEEKKQSGIPVWQFFAFGLILAAVLWNPIYKLLKKIFK